MSGFKDTTRTVSGHHNWSGGSIGGGTGGTINRLARGGTPVHRMPHDGIVKKTTTIPGLARGGQLDKISENPGHPEIYPKEGNRIQGNAVTLRKESPTQELEEHGGKTPLISKFKKGGSAAKHFHVHKHYHAKGGKTHTVSHSYSAAEKHAETYADGGHVHDDTRPPPGGPDYKRGGKTKPVKKNAGGAMYAPGGPVMGGMPQGLPAASALGRLAGRPQGLPMRQMTPPLRRPVGIPGPMPIVRARGGKV